MRFDVLFRWPSNAVGQNATLHKNVRVMSSSQLLTITESHGFRALLAVVAWMSARARRLWHGLRNLLCESQPARMEAASGSWWRILIGELAFSRREPVLWFDTMGRRDGPPCGGPRLWHLLPVGNPHLALAPALACGRTPGRGSFSRS